MAAAHQPSRPRPRPVPNFAFISSANLPREGEGERGRGREKNRLHIYAAHFSLSLPFPLPSLFLLPFLTFGKCQRKNCAQNEAQFTALVVCKLSHLQCAPRILLNHPSPLHPSAMPLLAIPNSIMIVCSRFLLLYHVCQRHFQVTSTNLFRFSFSLSLPSSLPYPTCLSSKR